MVLCALSLAFMAEAQESGSAEENLQDQQSGITFEYAGYDGGWGMGFTMNILHVELGYQLLDGETNEYLKTNEGWKVGLGGSYRYWFNKYIWVQGSVGVLYAHSTIEYDGADKEKEGNFGLYANPRIGLNIYSGICITASYRWDFNKFKFSKDYTDDYFTVGLAFVY